jgi:heme-degrading monooxygenase HmoA
MVYLKLKEDEIDTFRQAFSSDVIPIVKAHKGNRFNHLLECRENKSEAISVTTWDTKGDFEAYLKSGDYERTSEKYLPMFADEPIIKSYEVTASSEPLILRIF